MARGSVGPGMVAIAAMVLAVPAAVSAQERVPGSIPGVGSMMPQTSQINYTGAPGQAGASNVPDSDSGVSFIDSALPQTQVRLLIDGNYGFMRPGRAEYLFPKSGVAGSPGWWLPERNVDWQELVSVIEVAYAGTVSGFLTIPTRFVNPDINENEWGLADVDVGFKWAFFSFPGLTTTLQVRGSIPTRDGPGLSTAHYTVEPGLLINFRPAQWLALEGEARYWYPLGGTDFAGDMVRYGLGLTIGERNYDDAWITPVLEVIGWTLLDGQELVYSGTGSGTIRSVAGETIINGIAGVRFGFGDHGDIYLGYGRSLSGHPWQHDLWRLEFRVRF